MSILRGLGVAQLLNQPLGARAFQQLFHTHRFGHRRLSPFGGEVIIAAGESSSSAVGRRRSSAIIPSFSRRLTIP
jgi:hypothetical protein